MRLDLTLRPIVNSRPPLPPEPAPGQTTESPVSADELAAPGRPPGGGGSGGALALALALTQHRVQIRKAQPSAALQRRDAQQPLLELLGPRQAADELEVRRDPRPPRRQLLPRVVRRRCRAGHRRRGRARVQGVA